MISNVSFPIITTFVTEKAFYHVLLTKSQLTFIDFMDGNNVIEGYTESSKEAYVNPCE